MSTKRKIKAQTMWADTQQHPTFCHHNASYAGSLPVFVLPSDAASYDRMKEQLCFAIQESMAEDDSTLNAAIDALASLGITRPKRKGESMSTPNPEQITTLRPKLSNYRGDGSTADYIHDLNAYTDGLEAALRQVAPQEPHPDSVRLDWLEGQNNRWQNEDEWNVAHVSMPAVCMRVGELLPEPRTLRAAIDAAAAGRKHP